MLQKNLGWLKKANHTWDRDVLLQKKPLSLKPSLVPVNVGINICVIQQIRNSCQLYLMLLRQNLRERRVSCPRILMETAATPSIAANKATSNATWEGY